MVLTAAAGSGGTVVSLTSDNAAVTLPASVTVDAGSTAVSFTAVSAVSAMEIANLTASAGGQAESFAVQLDAAVQTVASAPALSGFNCGNSSVTGAGTDICTIALSTAAPSGGFTVSLTSNNAAVTVPASVTVGAGSSSASFTIAYSPVTSTQSAFVNASADGVVEAFALRLTAVSPAVASAPVLSGLTCASGSMTGAGTDVCTVTLNAAAPSGGFSVSLTSNNSAIAVPGSIVVAAGSASADFTASVFPVSTLQAVTITAGAGGVAELFSVQLNVGAPGIAINSSSIAFGNVPVNTTVTQSVELMASGPLPIAITAATVQGAGFSIAGATFPLTLVVGQLTTLDVTFDPSAPGAATGQLTIVSAALASGSTVINLSGTGELLEVNLSGMLPPAPDPVAGYNVYRAPSGSYSYQQINPSTVTQTSYVDLTVGAGQTYDYIVESVDASGNTSAPSNMASATLP